MNVKKDQDISDKFKGRLNNMTDRDIVVAIATIIIVKEYCNIIKEIIK